MLRVTITQIDAAQLPRQWQSLREHVQREASQLVLLPEMGFSPWFCASPALDLARWRRAVAQHERWLERLPELGADIVAGTAPRSIGQRRYNVAYLWTAAGGIQWQHRKTYLPKDEGFWESNWYHRAPVEFEPLHIAGLCIGFMICTEIWFMQHARSYGKAGVQLLLNPRSTPLGTNSKWRAGGRTAAVIAGAYCLSANHAGQAGDMRLGGDGWLCDPEGVVLARTDAAAPFLTVALDPARAEEAKSTYPRYVDDSPL